MTDGVARSLDTRLAKALSHPLRQRLLLAYGDRVTSPSELAAELGAPIGDVSYHTKRLVEQGCVELVRTDAGSGGVKHFYRATVRYEIDDDQWLALPAAVRGSVVTPILELLSREVGDAAAAGAFGDPEVHVTRMLLDLDQSGWDEVGRLLRSVTAEIQRINREAAERGGREPRSRPSTLGLLHFCRAM